jgi:hypothetical protein
MLHVSIIFPAILEFDQFESAQVRLEPKFPSVEIVFVDGSTGRHEFKVIKVLPHTHPTVLDSAVTEATLQIDYFITVLAFVRDTIIRPTGEIFYEFSGQRHQYNPPGPWGQAKLTGVASPKWFDANKDAMLADYDFEMVKRLNFARGIPEPIGKYIALYQLLLGVCDDRQSELDKLILSIDPTTHQSVAPRDGKLETLYTRMRNELAHVRPGANMFSTYQEVKLHLARFEWIVQKIIRPRCVRGSRT